MHDVIVVGARCAGASTAMLLARKGYQVLLVDRATFPSDIPHGHFIHRDGPRRLARWGLLDRIVASNCPAATTQVMDMGDFPLVGYDLVVDGIALGYGPRRVVFDQVVIDAAVDAGAELRTGFTVEGFTVDGDRITGIRGRTTHGTQITETASVVVGADGRRSQVARFVGAPEYKTFPSLMCWYFSYWSGMPPQGLEIYVKPGYAVATFPTNDSLVAVFVGWPTQCLAAVRVDIEGQFMAAVDAIPDLSARVRGGRREEPFKGATDLPNFYRKPFGPGWALVGDAGYHKDPMLALGMSDALRDAEYLTDALDEGLAGDVPLELALQDYEQRRNEESAADYQENLTVAQLKPPPDEIYQLRAALRDDPEATRQFYLARQGMIPRESFFNPENLRRLIGRVIPGGAIRTSGYGLTAALLCLLLLMPGAARGQARVTGTDLVGRVSDQSGSVIADAIVTVVNAETNVARTLHTDSLGRFQAPALFPGTYRILVERSGFARYSMDNVVLMLGQSADVEVVLKIAGREESVTVTPGSTDVDAARTAVSSVVGSRQIESLPINGRNFISFSVITPGVTTDRTPLQGALTTSGLSFAGQRARSNNIMVDGLDNNDVVTGSVRATFSQEAIREFQVLTTSYSAEFGKATGGVVNIVTKSGTNTQHGTLFGYLRDDALNAKDHFEQFDHFGNAVEREKAPFGQVQWGGVFGGPIARDKTFFFASFERSDIDASNFVTIDPAVADVLIANGFPVEVGNVPYAFDATEALAKIDHHFSPTSTIVARANVSKSTDENIEPFGGIVARSRGAVQLRKDWSLSASHTHVASRGWVNEARFQFARQNTDVHSLDPNCGGSCEGPFDGGPTIELPGIASAGRQRFTPQVRRNDRYQIMETVSWYAGPHSVKGGMELNHIENPLFQIPLHFGGRFIFAPLPANPALGLTQSLSAVQAFAMGLPAAYIQGYGDPVFSHRYDDLSVFFQDDWKIGQRLTLKAGVRYQRQIWPTGGYDVSNVGGSRFEFEWPQDTNDIAPRVAMAFDPTGRGTTSVHAAYGYYFDNHITGNFPVTQVVNGSTGVRTMALRLPATLAAWNAPGHRLPEPSTPFPSVELAIDPQLETPYARHAAVGFDRALANDVSLSADFVAVRGTRQLGTIDYNPIVPSLGAGRRPNDIDGRPGTSASVLQYTGFGETWYKGLTVSVNKRLSRRHQFLAAYTLSNAEDTSTDFQSAFLPESNGFGRNPSDPRALPLGFDPNRERGASSQDQRHRFVFSGIYQLPYGAQVSGILTAASGRPFTPLAGADLNGDGDGGAFPPDRARRNPADANTSVGRNSEQMPAQVVADVRFSKRFTMRNRVALDAMVEAFNLLNRTNFSEVNNVFGRGAFPADPQRDAQGRVTYGLFEQALPPRQVQLALRLAF
jgi:2-polyprenyl-6-methoxyphenol hydroxylase-like FAD-dependent oxidoreductase